MHGIVCRVRNEGGQDRPGDQRNQNANHRREDEPRATLGKCQVRVRAVQAGIIGGVAAKAGIVVGVHVSLPKRKLWKEVMHIA